MLNELKFTLGPNLYFYLEQNSLQYFFVFLIKYIPAM